MHQGNFENSKTSHGCDNVAFSDITTNSETHAADISKNSKQEKLEPIGNGSTPQNKPTILTGLQYKVEDNPPWPTSIFLGFQHYLMLLGSNLATPAIFATIMCAKGDREVTSVLMGNLLFACGLGTLLQSIFGTRLPIVQCPAFAFVVPMLAMIDIDEWNCPELNATVTGNVSYYDLPIGDRYWTTRLNLLAGSGMVAVILEVLIGASGVISILLKFIGPLTVAPTIMMIGLGVTTLGFDLAGTQWGISLGTLVMIILLSECIPQCTVVLPWNKSKYKNNANGAKTDIVFHKMFSVMISVAIMWLLCYLLTISDVLPKDPARYGHQARTDLRTDVLQTAPWFSFPYPGKFGAPTFSTAMFVGMIAGVLTSIIESIGDYYTCARIAGALPPPPSAVNRGILFEGIGCITAILVGSGFGVTSCSQNIGVISLTKVGSRRVVIVAGILLLFFGCFSKMSAFVVTVPDPIIGAAFIVLFAVLTAVGTSNLQYVDLNSPRNMLVFGMSLFVGLALPPWMTKNQAFFDAVDSGWRQIATALLGNNIFMACFTALIMDNLIPGTYAERGIIAWRSVLQDEGSAEDAMEGLTMKTYDFPFGMSFVRKWRWLRYVPFSPTFMGIEDIFNRCPCCNSNDTESLDMVTECEPIKVNSSKL